MTPEELKQKIQKLMDADLELMMKKNHDYSAAEDALSNFRDFGWRGIVVRIGDKYNRLKELAKGKEPKNESTLDSLVDLAVYSYLARVVYAESVYTPYIKCNKCGYEPKPGEVVPGGTCDDGTQVWLCPCGHENEWKLLNRK